MIGKHKRILLVDNEPAWLDFSRATLEEAGHSVATASSPKDIGEIVSQPNNRFDLILVDLKYAEQDGGLLGELARSGCIGRCIVVLFPTQMTPFQMVEMFRMGVVQDCVDKQYDKERLLSTVEEQLRKVAIVCELQEAQASF